MSNLNPYEEGLAADLAKAETRIKELQAQRNFAQRQVVAAETKLATCEKYKAAYAECDRIGTQAVRDLEAKLAKAVEALERIEDASKYFGSNPEASETTVRYAHETTRRLCSTTLAELKGKADE